MKRNWMAAFTPAGRVTTIVLCLSVLSLFSGDVLASTRPQDVSALNGLAASWSSGANLNWYGDPCDNSWTGVGCANQTNPATVTTLSLADSELKGELSSAIGGLTNLQTLELSRNQYLGGPLPSELGSLINLQYLSLQWCSFNGFIPSNLGNLVNLTFLGLNGNVFVGNIPPTFGNLTKLTWLDISVNEISGPIPVSSSAGSNGIGLNNMSVVKHFHFNNNSLSGSLPVEIFSIKTLIHLILDHNQFNSNIPPAISNSQNLTILRLDNNQFNGTIPHELANISTLQNLNLQNNLLSGSLPDLSGLTSLQLLDVSQNQLTTEDFPTWISSMSTLQTLNLADMNVIGNIPSAVFGLPQMQSLNFSRNQVNGTLDFSVEASQSLQVIDGTNNSITGFAGQPEFGGQPLQALNIMLEGNPLCFNPYLSFTDLTCGTDAVSKGWAASLNSSCSNVKCVGQEVLNYKTCACAYPLDVDLQLTGPTMSNLTAAMATSIETEIASQMTSLRIINLDPEQVFISFGSINDVARYNLNVLFFPAVGTGSSLSDYNSSRIVAALTQRRITLVEGPFQIFQSPSPPVARKGGNSISTGAIVGIVVGVSVVALLLLAYAVRQKMRADKAAKKHPFASWGGGTNEFGDAPMLKGARWFPLAELKAATNNWSEQNLIGEGGYGKVYKGVLKSGDVVAIKRAGEGSMQGAEEFKNEIELLSRVHHRNLVGLVGFCYEQGEQALIYEFMSNGSVRDHLLGQAPLSWQERLDIALGSARGLAYLHDHANPPIIHRDVKSANILMNERKVAKVSDFGLSKIVPDQGEKTVYSENVKGTLGYLDPEYYTSHQLTHKSDVYSFGIVLFELLTAKAPIVKGKSVVREFRLALERGGLTELRPLLDPWLRDLSNLELEEFLKIAFNCVQESSVDRPTMGSIVKDLEDLGAHSFPNSGVHKLDVGGHRPLDSLDETPSEAKEGNDPSFQYSGTLGVSTTVPSK